MLLSYRESLVATFDPICNARDGGTRQMLEGGNNLHVSRIIRGREHARTKPERICTGICIAEDAVISSASCKHVNRPRPSSPNEQRVDWHLDIIRLSFVTWNRPNILKAHFTACRINSSCIIYYIMRLP